MTQITTAFYPHLQLLLETLIFFYTLFLYIFFSLLAVVWRKKLRGTTQNKKVVQGNPFFSTNKWKGISDVSPFFSDVQKKKFIGHLQPLHRDPFMKSEYLQTFSKCVRVWSALKTFPQPMGLKDFSVFFPLLLPLKSTEWCFLQAIAF